MGLNLALGCGCCSSGHPVSGCPCPTVPSTVFLTSNDPTRNAGNFPNDTFVWGPPPSAVASGFGAGGFPNVTGLWAGPHSGGGNTWYVLLSCTAARPNEYAYFRVYTAGALAGSWQFEGPHWGTILTGYTCSPFSFPRCVWDSGFDTTQVIALHG